jgi:TPR repeat protein
MRDVGVRLGSTLTGQSEQRYRAQRDMRRRARAGDIEAGYQVGLHRFRYRVSLRQAEHYLRRAARAGHAEAAGQLAYSLSKWRLPLPQGRKRRMQQSVEWARRAARLADKSAPNVTTIARDLDWAGHMEQAEGLLREAADGGNARAAHNLAAMMQKPGRFRPVEAERYYRLACDLGYQPAAERIGTILTEAGRDQDAEHFYRIAAAHHSIRAARILGRRALAAGDDHQALHYLRIAADSFERSHDDLLSSLEESLTLNDDVLAYIDALARAGRAEEVIRQIQRFDRVLHQSSRFADTREMYKIGQRLRAAGLEQEGKRFIDRATDIDMAASDRGSDL